MEHRSYWMATAPRFTSGAKRVARHYDVAVIGAGFTGLSAARVLAKAGKRVAVFEAGPLGAGASGRNGGHLNNGLAHGYAAAMARFGADRARALYHSYDASIDLIEAVIREEGIACDFRRSGKLKFASRPGHAESLRAACDLIAQEADPTVRYLDPADLGGELVTEAAHGAMLYPKSAMMHMGRYLIGLAGAVARHGADLFERAPVTDLLRTGGGWQLETLHGPVQAREVIVATGGLTGAHAGRALARFRRRIIPVGSYIIATRPLTRDEINATVPGRRTYVNTLNIGAYFRLSPDDRLIFGGRAKFSARSDAATDKASGAILRQSLSAMFPRLSEVELAYCWGGLVDMTRDRLPRAGQLDGLWYAMGYSGHGAQMSTLMGASIAGCVLGQSDHPLDFLDWPALPAYGGRPWFLPAVGLYYRIKDLIG